jgi:hypothetical protein
MIMNKKGFLKALMIGLVIAVAAVFVAGNVMAQVLNTQIMLQNRSVVGIDADGELIDVATDGTLNQDDASTVLVDNFEYWNNPRNMGWNVIEPSYPVWGAGLGYGQVNNILDFEQGSRVLDVYRPMSVFLMNTPYDVYQIVKPCYLADGNSIQGDFSAMSLEVRAPLAIEQFDNFQIIVSVKASSGDHGGGRDAGEEISIVFRPIEGPQGYYGILNPLEDGEALGDDDVILVALGRQFQDGTWHLVMEDLAEIIAQYDRGADENVFDPDEPVSATNADDDGRLESVEAIMIRGNQYRLDNIMFTKPARSISGNGAVHFFHVGPIYCQLYGQMGYNSAGRWLLAEDGDLGMGAEYVADVDDYDYDFKNRVANFDEGALLFPDITDPNDIPFFIGADGTVDGYFSASRLFLPGDEDQDGIMDADAPNLSWVLTMGDSLGAVITDEFVEVATVDEDFDAAIEDDDCNSWPPYLIQEDGVMIRNMVDPNYDPDVDLTPYMQTLENPMYAVASALLNSGYAIIPQAIRIVPHLGQVIEDMIVTARVSDGICTDKETFPVSVVNYPVTNHPPIINDVDDQIFYVGMQNGYKILAIDPDPQDMLSLTYTATLDGVPSYQYGPWMNQIINPSNGVVSFVPQFEGALDCIITVRDPRGMSAVCAITIFCVNQGTWFNHPPIILGDLDSPQTIRAGEMFVADEMDFQDPDGDKMYWSCNVGSVGNNGVYTFQTMFPGYYMVQITAYDIRGGAATTEFVIHVRPWWSM